MLSPAELALGLAALALLLALPVGSALCLQRAFFPADAWSERLAIQGTLAAATALYPTLALGYLGALGLGWLLAIEVAAAAASAALWRRAGRPRPAPDPAWRSSPAHWALLVALGATALFVVDQALRHPPLAWDDLYYHLPRVVEWYQSGAIGPLYHPAAAHPSYYPGHLEIFVLWAVLPLGHDLLAGWTNLLFLALGALAVQRLAVDAGAPARLAPLAPLAFVLTPAVARLAPTAYAELLLVAAALLALHFSLRAASRRAPGDFVLAGLAAGIVAGTKVTGPLYAAIAVLPALVAARGAPLAAWGGLLVAAAPGGAWLLANAVATGNPVYPFALLGLPGIPLPFEGRSLGSRFWELASGGHLWGALVGSRDPGIYESGIGLKVVPLAGVWIWALARAGRSPGWAVQGWLLFAALAWGTLFALSPVYFTSNIYLQVRFLAPSLAICVAVGVAALAQRSPPAALGLVALCVASDLPALVRDAGEAARLALAAAGAAALVALAARWRPGRVARRALLAGTAPALAALGVGLYTAYEAREAGRHEHYATDWSLFRTIAPFYAPGWRFFDRHAGAQARVAFHGFDFLYPVYGPRLGRRVRYVDVDARAGAAHHAYPAGANRAAPDPTAWERNLDEFGAEWLYLERSPWERDFPDEQRWADARPARFELAFENGWTRIYRVEAPRDPEPEPR